jgi:HSP20 family molecular chaperone IbpA
MTWNEIVSGVREKLRHTFGHGDGQDVPVVPRGPRLEQLGNVPLARPVVDVYENDREILIQADVPGGNLAGTTVAWDESHGLTVLVKAQGLPSGTLWAAEYQPCDWYRAIELPDYVDGSKAVSALKGGVLTIRVPKRAAVAKLIPVKAG